ncbi:MAG: hypothetical protein AB7T10_04680 [bacterium]
MRKAIVKEPCRLCKNNTELCESHILPEFMYTELYDEKHRFVEIDVERKKERFGQKGIREYLFCKSCETLMSKYENYASDVLRRNIYCNASTKKMYRGKVIYEVLELNYNKLLKYFLIVAYRSAISSKVFFQNCKLDSFKLNTLEVLINDVKKEVPRNKYPLIVIKLINRVFKGKTVLREPSIYNLPNHLDSEFYRLFNGNFIFMQGLQIKEFRKYMNDFSLKENGSILIPEFDSITSPEIKSLFGA